MGLNKFEIINKCLDEIKDEAISKNLSDEEVHDFLIKEIEKYNLKSLIRKSCITREDYIVWIIKNRTGSMGFAMQLYEELYCNGICVA